MSWVPKALFRLNRVNCATKYLLSESYVRLAENEGKQAPDQWFALLTSISVSHVANLPISVPDAL